jgi:RimJ/RimL family protein N-acetyltransferase
MSQTVQQPIPAEIIETHGVRLRPIRDTDLDDVVAACNDPMISDFLAGLPMPYTRADAEAWAATDPQRLRASGGGVYVIADPTTDRLLGSIDLHNDYAGDRSARSVGYWVAPWARRRGVAANATRALTEQAFETGISRVELHHRLDNPASMRVAMSAGFTHEGVRRAAALTRDGRPMDRVMWSRLASDPGDPNLPELPDLPKGELTDGVVTLIPLGVADADDYFALAQLPEVIATTVTATPLTREEVARRCLEAPYVWLLGRQARFTIRDASTGAFAGLVSMMCEGVTRQAMLGYEVTREYRGRGFTPRAVRLLIDWAFDVVGMARLTAGAAPDNLASQRVLEKTGFTREGYERARLPRTDGEGGRIDNIAWALLPDDPRP